MRTKNFLELTFRIKNLIIDANKIYAQLLYL